MTEDFAGAMVTVIPIILLLGSAEFLKFSTAFVERLTPVVDREGVEAARALLGQEPVAPSPRPLLPPPIERTASMLNASLRRTLNIGWIILAAFHVYAEIRLIQWLATTERPEAPAMAKYITEIAAFGFVMLVVGALLPTLLLSILAPCPSDAEEEDPLPVDGLRVLSPSHNVPRAASDDHRV
ncbi:hypothetical protein ACWDUX_32295 [Streptomyces sp. NPDC003444]